MATIADVVKELQKLNQQMAVIGGKLDAHTEGMIQLIGRLDALNESTTGLGAVLVEVMNTMKAMDDTIGNIYEEL